MHKEDLIFGEETTSETIFWILWMNLFGNSWTIFISGRMFEEILRKLDTLEDVFKESLEKFPKDSMEDFPEEYLVDFRKDRWRISYRNSWKNLSLKSSMMKKYLKE